MKAGIPAAHSAAWCRLGVTAERALELNAAGVDPLQALQLRQIGLPNPIQWAALKGAVEVAQAWLAAAFEPPEALEWTDAGFGPHDAAAWRRESISAQGARRWRDLGVGVDVASRWHSHVEDPLIESDKWTTRHDPPLRPEEALAWSRNGFSTSEDWFDDFAIYREAGLTPEDAPEFLEVLRRDNEIRSMSPITWDLRNLRAVLAEVGLAFTASNVARWGALDDAAAILDAIDEGFTSAAEALPSDESIRLNMRRYADFLETCASLVQQGASPALAEEWASTGQLAAIGPGWAIRRFGVEEAEHWQANGFSNPDVASEWRAADFSAGDANVWAETGLGPDLSARWRNVDVSPATAVVRSAAGLQPRPPRTST